MIMPLEWKICKIFKINNFLGSDEKTVKVKPEKKAHSSNKEKHHEPDEKKKFKTFFEKEKADDDEQEGLAEREVYTICYFKLHSHGFNI